MTNKASTTGHRHPRTPRMLRRRADRFTIAITSFAVAVPMIYGAYGLLSYVVPMPY